MDGDPVELNWVRRRSPPAMKPRAIGPGGRQMGGAAVPFPMSFYAKGLEGHIYNPDAG